MNGVAGEVVFASAGLRATFRDAGAADRPLVVTFDSLNADLRLDRPGFGEAWLAQCGYDAVHVVSARNAWYQDRDTPALLETVRSAVAERARVVTYGSSMGGYAAVRFAAALGAHAAVALSPQFSIDPAAAPWETRWTEYAHGLVFGEAPPAARVGAPERVFVVFDPLNRDRLHADALARLHPVVAAPVRHAGHPAGTFLAESGLLSQAVQAMIEDRFDPALFQRQVRDGRRRSAAYLYALARRQPARRAVLALGLVTAAARLAPLTAAYHAETGEQLARLGDLPGAEAALRRAQQVDPGEPIARLRLAEHLVLHGGDPAEVEALVRGLESLGAVREWMFVRAVDLLFATGAYAAARDEARSGLRRLPRSRLLRGRAWGLGAILAVPGVGQAALEALRPWLLQRRLGGDTVKEKRLVGATGFEPATP